jgi:hypothetical protein
MRVAQRDVSGETLWEMDGTQFPQRCGNVTTRSERRRLRTLGWDVLHHYIHYLPYNALSSRIVEIMDIVV